MARVFHKRMQLLRCCGDRFVGLINLLLVSGCQFSRGNINLDLVQRAVET